MIKDYAEDFLTAMSSIVESKIANLAYDRTIICTVINVENADNGEYIVSDGSTSFKAYSQNDTVYKNDDNVYVQIPGGDYNKQKWILGKQTGENSQSINYVSPFDSYFDITGNLMEQNFDSKNPYDPTHEYGLLANDPTPDSPNGEYLIVEHPDYTGKVIPDTIYLPIGDIDCLAVGESYERLGLQADFRSWVPTAISGDYGLELRISSTAPLTSGSSSQQTLTTTLRLNASDMWGNPYNFENYFTQEAVADISELGTIDRIQVLFYQSTNFLIDNLEKLPYFINEDKLFDNLFVKNIKVSLGYPTYDKEKIILYTNNSLTYKDTSSVNQNRKTVKLRWAHLTETTGSQQCVSITKISDIEKYFDLDSNNVYIHLYRYNKEYEDSLAGSYWQELMVNEKPWITAVKSKYILDTNENYIETQKYFKYDKTIDKYTEINVKAADWHSKTYYIYLENNLENKDFTYIFDPDVANGVEHLKAIIEIENSTGLSRYYSIHQDKEDTYEAQIAKLNSDKEYALSQIAYYKSLNFYTNGNDIGVSGAYDGIISDLETDISNCDTSINELQRSHSRVKMDVAPYYTYLYSESYNKETNRWDPFLTFSNEKNVPNTETTNLIVGLKLSVVDTPYNGNYPIYDSLTNELITSSMASKNRFIYANFESLFTQDKNAGITEIRWYIPKHNTMIQVPEAETHYDTNLENEFFSQDDGYYIIRRCNPSITTTSAETYSSQKCQATQGFKIKKHFFQQATNNLIKCEIDRAGKTYSAEALLTFGIHGSNGTNNTLVLSIEKETAETRYCYRSKLPTSGSNGIVYLTKKREITTTINNKEYDDDKAQSLWTMTSDEQYIINNIGCDVECYRYNPKATSEDLMCTNYTDPKVELKIGNNTAYIIQDADKKGQSDFTEIPIDKFDKITIYSYGGEDGKIQNRTKINYLTITYSTPSLPKDVYYKYIWNDVQKTWEKIGTYKTTQDFADGKEIIEKENITNIPPAWTSGSTKSLQLKAELYNNNDEQVDISGYTTKWEIVDFHYGNGFKINETGLLTSTSDSIGCIVKCSVGYKFEKDYPSLYTGYIIIPTRSNRAVGDFTGSDRLIYGASGTEITYSKSEYKINDKSTTVQLFYYDGSNAIEINDATNYKDTNKTTKKYFYYIPYIDTYNRLNPRNMFYNDVKYEVWVTLTNNYGRWTQPIWIIQNAWTSSLLNNWDGKLQIDESSGTILSTMVGAGKKNAQNQFEGILMGDVQNGAEVSSESGIYGYKDGVQAFGFKTGGTAFIGKSGRTQLKFDGNSGTIQNGGYSGGNGMLLNFDGGGTTGAYLDMKNGNAQVKISTTNPFFEIKSGNNKSLMYVGNKDSAYYLQSENYIADGTGLKIDLKNGSLTSKNFTINSTGNIWAHDGDFTGTINSSDGNIGGWTIGPRTLTGGSTTLDSDGTITCNKIIATNVGTIGDWTIGDGGFGLSGGTINAGDINGANIHGGVVEGEQLTVGGKSVTLNEITFLQDIELKLYTTGHKVLGSDSYVSADTKSYIEVLTPSGQTSIPIYHDLNKKGWTLHAITKIELKKTTVKATVLLNTASTETTSTVAGTLGWEAYS